MGGPVRMNRAMYRKETPVRTRISLLILLAAAGPLFLAAQTQPVTRTSFESSEGTFTTRSVAENSFAGVNVGSPVSAVGSGSLAYTLSGTDAGSFSIVAGTGQIRTKDGVTYDYETKNRYSVTVGVEDGSGNTDTIAVAIEIEDLGPSCMAPPDFRTITGDRSVTVRWTPLEDTEGNARVWGYQVEMRRGSNGIWGTPRTLLGREVTGTVYTGLLNAIPHQFRIRPLQAESDCEWRESEIVSPQVAQRAPRDPEEHFRRVGRRPVGTPERNYRFLSPERCRHTAGSSTLDATCRYANTGPRSGTITLEFDDPSQPGCEVSLAYSSLTAGSFRDECFGAGVRVAVDFDTSFRLPPMPEAEEQEIPRAPRSQEEFEVLAWGRDDLVPGLGFSCPPGIPDCEFVPGKAYRIERDPDARTITYAAGSYFYERTGPARGVLTFKGRDGKTFVFTLDVQPSGRMQMTVADPDGNSPGWPGMPDTLLQGSSLPVLLPIPPSWSAAMEVESDIAPEDFAELELRIPENPDNPSSRVQSLLLGDTWDRAFMGGSLAFAHDYSYRKIGRNRATLTITWELTRELADGTSPTPLQQSLLGTGWVFDIRFGTEDSATFELTITREEGGPITLRRFLDLKAGSSSTDTFPDELTLPDEPPQESGQDSTGVQIAPVTTPAGIWQNDIQTFLVHNAGPQTASYAPGDWLEPKDGGNQRMMVVASGQPATAGPTARARPSKLREPAMPARLGSLAGLLPYRPPDSPPPPQQSMNPALTQISVVCMQRERDVPPRGARYFSQPKTAEGEVQLCQKNCATAGGDAIQRCVWDCETNPSGETYTPTPVWTVRVGQVRMYDWTLSGCMARKWNESSKWQRRDDEGSPWTDIPGTERTGSVCSYSPTETGQYRAVGVLTIDGNRDRYASNNILTVEGSPEKPSFGTATVSNQTGTFFNLFLPEASGGDGTLSYSLSPSVPGLEFDSSTRLRHLFGRPEAAGTYSMTYTARDVDGDIATLNFILTVMPTTVMPTVDLVVSGTSVSSTHLVSGQSFDFTARPSNRGTAAAAATTLRFYLSTDYPVSTDGTPVGTAAVGALSPSGSIVQTMTLTAPTTGGTYHYVACVDTVSGESDTSNNCSSSSQIVVEALRSDLVVESPSVSNSSPTTGSSFRVEVTVRNRGAGAAAATTLRFYRSTDRTISTDDTHVGTAAVGALSPSGSIVQTMTLTAPTTGGTYYYGTCVDTVSGESDTSNNCSSSVAVFGGGPFPPYDLAITRTELHAPSIVRLDESPIYMTVVVTNNGPNASRPAMLRFSGGAERDIPVLQPNETKTYYRKWVGRASWGITTYQACIVETPADTKTSNNCSSRSVTYIPQ